MAKSFRMSARGGLLVAMALALVFAGAFVPGPVLAVAVAPDLGEAGDFAVLAYSTVTNTGSTVITTGDVGVYAGTSITGFPPGLVLDGGIYIAGGHAGAGQTDLAAAYVNLAGQAYDSDLSGQDLGSVGALTPGVYRYSSAAGLTNTLTLDAGGDPTAVWIFQIGSTLTTQSGAVVDVINGGSACNVFWQVGTSATIGTGTTFVGDILAMESITMTTNATTTGRLLARTGAVTLDGNTISPCDAVNDATSLSIFKFYDVNGDGVYDPDTDIPLSGWVFSVLDPATDPVTGSPFTTDEFGFIHLVDVVTGTYTVTETVKSGWIPTTTGGDTQTGTVVDGESTLLLFGNELEPGAVGIFKFRDWNGNGQYDPIGDRPLAGWQFAVVGTGGPVAGSPFTTDASGFIVITGLPADTYTVTEAVQPGWTITTDNDQQVVVGTTEPGGGMLFFGNQYTYVPPSSTMPVGGEAGVVNKVALLMPWLIILAVVAGVAMVARRSLRSYR